MNAIMTCPACGLRMSKNPHPDAGIESRRKQSGDIFECIPCLVKDRYLYATMALDLKHELQDYKWQHHV